MYDVRRVAIRVAGILLASAALVPSAGAVASAYASTGHGLETGFSDSLYGSANPSVRAQWLDRTVQAGAGLVRFNVAWSAVVGPPPAHPTNPADPSYDFSGL